MNNNEDIYKLLSKIIIGLMTFFHLIMTFCFFNPVVLRAGHLLFSLLLIFLLNLGEEKKKTSSLHWSNALLCIASIISVGGYLIRASQISKGVIVSGDYIIGGITIVLVLEATRRTTGWMLTLLSAAALLYGKFGYYLTGYLAHSGFSVKRIIKHIAMGSEGIYGSMLGVSSSYIFLFVLFGSLLSASGAARTYNDLALSVAGTLRGGAAKVAVLASGLIGSVTGSASANVATTGIITIPLMEKCGYKDYYASAVEAVASTGGQIMPPVMGAASFLIADSLGIPFSAVIKGALIPAVLYYFGIWIMIDLRSRKENIKGLEKKRIPNALDVLKKGWYHLIPLLLVFTLLFFRIETKKAVFYGMLSCIVSYLLFTKKEKGWLRNTFEIISNGLIGVLPIAISCAVIGNIIGIASLTGAIINIGQVIVGLGRGKLWLTLILTMFSALLMGLGIPTTAVYVLTSTIAAPAIISFGVNPLGAHLFVFYFGILAAVTPPVCNAAYTAAGLSGANPNKTGYNALKLASAGFVVPFAFIFHPELLILQGTSLFRFIMVLILTLLGIFCLSLAMEGYLVGRISLGLRIIIFITAILIIVGDSIISIFGIVILTVIIVYCLLKFLL